MSTTVSKILTYSAMDLGGCASGATLPLHSEQQFLLITSWATSD